jgi:hypothetical protein
VKTNVRFFITSRSFLIRMRNILYKSYRQSQNTHFMFSNFFFENRAVDEVMWKNIVEPDTPQMTIWRLRFACWLQTHSEYTSIIFTAFPLQQRLHKRASVFPDVYIAPLVLPICFSVMWKNVGVLQLITYTIFEKSIQEGVERTCRSSLWPRCLRQSCYYSRHQRSLLPQRQRPGSPAYLYLPFKIHDLCNNTAAQAWLEMTSLWLQLSVY